MLSQNFLQSVSHDFEFLRLLSMVWMDAKDWRLTEFEKLAMSRDRDGFNAAVLLEARSPQALAILKSKRWWTAYEEKALKARAQGLRWVSVLDSEYPQGFFDLDVVSGVSPLGFWAQGALPRERCVSVVGSRYPVSGVVLWMKAELEPLSVNPWTLVSGGARGVDLWAHEICLNRKTPTVVVLPSGILEPYPTDWGRLRRQVLDSGGGFLSEYDCSFPIRKYHFQARNRLIAAFSPLTLILQAARKSGTWMTANWGVSLSRMLGVVPGPAWDRRFSGTHDLIRGGNPIVTERADVESLLSSAGRHTSSSFS